MRFFIFCFQEKCPTVNAEQIDQSGEIARIFGKHFVFTCREISQSSIKHKKYDDSFCISLCLFQYKMLSKNSGNVNREMISSKNVQI